MSTTISSRAALLRKPLLSIVLLSTLACGESKGEPEGGDVHDSMSTVGAGDGGGHEGAPDSGQSSVPGDGGVPNEAPQDASAPVPELPEDASIDPSPTPVYGEDGCLTYASASALCGFSSNGAACNAYASCGMGSAPQCQINCEMYTTFKCLDSDFVATCLAAVNDGCDALSVCQGWLY